MSELFSLLHFTKISSQRHNRLSSEKKGLQSSDTLALAEQLFTDGSNQKGTWIGKSCTRSASY